MSSNFWETIWQILVVFVLVAYLIVLFQIIVDLFRDKKLGGFSKAIWFLGLIFVPIFTALLYILFRGRGMSERQIEAVKEARAETDAYIRSVAGSKSPTEQIAEAKALLDSGAISADEFARLKSKALGAIQDAFYQARIAQLAPGSKYEDAEGNQVTK